MGASEQGDAELCHGTLQMRLLRGIVFELWTKAFNLPVQLLLRARKPGLSQMLSPLSVFLAETTLRIDTEEYIRD